MPITICYDGQIVGDYVADIVVEDQVILELNSDKDLHPAHESHLVNYLKATGKEIGLLNNFGHKIEIKRKILTPPPADGEAFKKSTP